VNVTFCAAIGSQGIFTGSLTTPLIPWVSTFNGSVWHTVKLVLHRPTETVGRLWALASVSASHCVAVGSMWSGNAPGRTTALEDTWNGERWNENNTGVLDGVQNAQIIDGAACTRSYCMVTGEYRRPHMQRRFQLELMLESHQLFTEIASPGYLEDGFDTFSGCAGDGTCLFLEPGDLRNAPIVYFTNHSPSTERQLSLPETWNNLNSLSCASPRWCVVAGEESSTSPRPTVSILVWNGTTFSSAYLQSPEAKSSG